MDDCDARKAFDSLWSITDEIFKYVADIRTILNGSKGSVSEKLPCDPPSYEASMPEQLVEHIGQKLSCLEELNEKRKALLEEFSIPLKSDDLCETKQIEEKPSGHTHAVLRDNALKSFVSYIRSRQVALRTNLSLLERASQRLSEFCSSNYATFNQNKELIYGCADYSESKLDDGLNMCEDFNLHLIEDRVALLREGKMLEETLLEVPHEKNEETDKILKDLQTSYLKIKNADVFTFNRQISPILEEYLKIQKRHAIRNAVNSVIVKMQHSFNEYTQMVEAYNQALQSLADNLIV
ncbi:unnamed protein product [Calicophoron daubneyi]|uniref:Uncharacterized protein n=1 Tax=Calicophoron daubneyi TaxID=300641 RepID=A0AAV2TLQ6_CALDB